MLVVGRVDMQYGMLPRMKGNSRAVIGSSPASSNVVLPSLQPSIPTMSLEDKRTMYGVCGRESVLDNQSVLV